MATRRKKKSPFSPWLSYLEAVCRRLYNMGEEAAGQDLQRLYIDGVRITLAVMFQRIAVLQAQPAGPFASFFLYPGKEIPLEPIDFPLGSLPGGLPLELFPDPEFPGRFYGECLRYGLKIDKRGAVYVADGRSRRNSGAFYTPEVITDYIARETLAPLTEDKPLQEILKLRICDPAMGTGNFLSAAGRFLSGIIRSNKGAQESLFDWNETVRNLLTKTLFGVDRDPVAVMIARSYFALQCGIPPEQITNLVVADSLIDDLPFRRRFDAVIGNPPWVSYGLRGLGKISGDIQKKYRERFPNSAEYKISVYALFMEMAMSLVRHGGYVGYIVPDSWLVGRFFRKLRSFLLEEAAFKRLVLISRDFWEGLSIGRSVLYVLRKNGADERHPPINGAVVPAPEHLNEAEMRIVPLEINRIRNRDRNRIVIYTDSRSKEFAERMEDSGDILGNHIRFYSGLIGRQGRKSIVIEGKPANYSPGTHGRLIDSGKFLHAHRILYRERYIRHDPSLYKSGYAIEKYLNPKIFVNQTGYILKSCYDEHGFFCLNNLHIAYPVHEDVDLRFFSVLLNSNIINRYYRIMSMEQGRALAQTDIDFLDQLPVGTDAVVYREMVSLVSQNFTPRVDRKNAIETEYAYNIPAPVYHQVEALLAKWYGVRDL